MKPALYLALLLANFLQQPSGPTAITSGGHSIFYGPQQGQAVYVPGHGYHCVPAGTECSVGIGPPQAQKPPNGITGCTPTDSCITVTNALKMPESEATFFGPTIKNGRKVYMLDLKPDWTCRPSSNFVGGNLLHPPEPTLVTLTCVKSDAAPDRSAK